jgi:hypothetical protein
LKDSKIGKLGRFQEGEKVGRLEGLEVEKLESYKVGKLEG